MLFLYYLLIIVGPEIVSNGQPVGAYSLELTFETTKHGSLIGNYGASAGKNIFLKIFFLVYLRLKLKYL